MCVSAEIKARPAPSRELGCDPSVGCSYQTKRVSSFLSRLTLQAYNAKSSSCSYWVVEFYFMSFILSGERLSWEVRLE